MTYSSIVFILYPMLSLFIGEDVEYKIKLTIDKMELISWKRYADFEALANACYDYTKICSRRKHRIKQSLSRRKRIKLDRTVLAWNNVCGNRPWFYRQLEPSYLTKELRLLNAFMKALLFEIPFIQLLTEFMQN